MVDFYTMPDGDAMAEAMEMDSEFFEEHPEKTVYCRLAIPGEDFGFFPPLTLAHVENFGDGMQLRTLIFPPEEKWADLEAEWGGLSPDERWAKLEAIWRLGGKLRPNEHEPVEKLE
ncbi:MAG: hypothetical protein MUO26_07900 [Methanotrichaceae archaeon]|nr:hypothetical protein [Methanotrichaceae archaeon]